LFSNSERSRTGCSQKENAVDLEDLRVFTTVVDQGGIAAAARKLHRVPSGVSTRVQQLEAALGVRLFVRERQRLHLSAEGERLLDYADRLLRLADEARSAVAGEPRGVFRLGALESTTASRLPAVLARFHRECPDVRVELITGTNDVLTAAVAERRLDAAFVAEAPASPALDHLPLFAETLVVITARTHRQVRTARDVRDDTVIAFPHGCAYRRVLERWLRPGSLQRQRVLELASYHAIVACVASGTGVAVMPESVLDALDATQVERHPLPRAHARVVTPLVWRRADAPPAVTALRQMLAGASPAHPTRPNSVEPAGGAE
jgi:DNA-binding transcriptional LysR family regulator